MVGPNGGLGQRHSERPTTTSTRVEDNSENFWVSPPEARGKSISDGKRSSWEATGSSSRRATSAVTQVRGSAVGEQMGSQNPNSAFNAFRSESYGTSWERAQFHTYQSYRSSEMDGMNKDVTGSPNTPSSTEQEYHRSSYKRTSAASISSSARFSSPGADNSSTDTSPIRQSHAYKLLGEPYGERPDSRGNDSNGSTWGYSPQRDSPSSSPAVESGLANARSLSFGSPTFFISPASTTTEAQQRISRLGGSAPHALTNGAKPFDPLKGAGRSSKKKTRKPREILYAASSEDVCPLAILLYAQGVKVTVPDKPYVPSPRKSDLEAKRKSIMDKYRDVLGDAESVQPEPMAREAFAAPKSGTPKPSSEDDSESRAAEEKLLEEARMAAAEAAAAAAEQGDGARTPTRMHHRRSSTTYETPENLNQAETTDLPPAIIMKRSSARPGDGEDDDDSCAGVAVLHVMAPNDHELSTVPERGLGDEDDDSLMLPTGDVNEGSARLLAHLAFRDDMRDAIVKAGALTALVNLLKDGKPGAKEAAATALAELALKDDLRKAIARERAIPPLVDLLDGASESGKEAAAGALGNLAFDDDNKVEIAEAGAIPPLVRLLKNGSEPGKEAAAGALGNLAFNDDNKEKIRDAGAIPPLVELLKPSHSQEAQEASGVCLWNLGLDPESRRIIVACGALPLLVQLLESSGEKVRRTAAGALGKLALDDDSRVEIANLNGIPKLLYIVANHGEDERETAANALTNLARNDMCRQIISSSSVKVEKRGENVTGVTVLVTLTDDGADAGRVAGSKCVANLACNPNLQREVAEKHGIPPLVRMLRDSSEAGKESAATAIGNLACNDGNKVLIASEGGIPPMVDLLRDGPLSGQEAAAGALWNLAMNDDNRIAVREAGGIPYLIRLLYEHSTDSGKEAASVCLWNLACNADNRVAIHQWTWPDSAMLRGIPALVNLLGHEAARVRKGAAGALGKCALLEENRQEIERCGGTSILLEMMKDLNGTEREVAVSALTNLALSDNLRVKIGGGGGVPPIVRFLEDGSNAAKTSASNAVANLVCTPHVKDMVVREKAIPKLVALLRSGHANVAAAASGALANLACDGPSGVEIVQLEGLQALCELLNSEHPASQEAAARAMMNLSLYDENKALIPKVDGDKALIKALTSGPPGAKQAAAATITNLAWQPDIRKRICDLGAVRPLVELLAGRDASPGMGSDTAAKALYNLASTEEAKALIISEGALAPLNAQVSQGNINAAGTLRRLAESEQNAVFIAESGSVVPLVHMFRTGTEIQKEVAAAGLKVLSKTPKTKDKMVEAMGEKDYKKLTKSQGFFKKLTKGFAGPGRGPNAHAGKGGNRTVSTLEQDTDTVNKVSAGGHDTVNY